MCIKVIQTRKENKNNTLQTLMKKVSLIIENFGILLNKFFSEKTKSRESIVLIEKGKTIYREDEVANTFDYFSNIFKILSIHHLSINAIRFATKNLSSSFFPSRQKRCYKRK